MQLTQNKITKAMKAGNQLVHQTIYNQAGSIEKAILEYIMNSVDANATEIRILINDNGINYSIIDNGDGFGDASYTREEKEKCIDEVFGHLGFDHGTAEENTRTYGKFGIGRAQLWAFSKNTWHTHNMTMDVDIKNNGLSYEIEEVDDFFNGCKIVGSFYDRIALNQILYLKKELAKYAAFAPIDVYFNDKKINKKISKLKDKLKIEGLISELNPTGSLKVYNQGIFVKEYNNYLFGVGGVICSKVGYPFELNAARNDVLQSKCVLWKKLKKALDKKLNSDVKKTTLTNELRKSILAKVAVGDYGENGEYLSKPLIKMIDNRYISIKNCLLAQITITESSDDPKAERIHNDQTAKVLLSEFTDSLGINNDDFIQQLKEIKTHLKKPIYSPDYAVIYTEIEKLKSTMSDDYYTIPQKDLTSRQKLFLEAMNSCSVQSGLKSRTERKRKVFLGRSDSANGWTDGFSYIVINEDLYNRASDSAGHVLRILMVLVHEYNHDKDNTDLHSLDFYKNTHDQILMRSPDIYLSFISFIKLYTSRLIKKDFVIPKKLKRSLNMFDTFVEEVEELKE